MDDEDTTTDVAPWALRPVVVAASLGDDGLKFYALDVAAEKLEDYETIARVLLASDGYLN